MKKRVVSILVVLAMLISSFASVAVNVFAEDTYKKVTSAEEITTGKYVLVTDGYAMGAYANGWLAATGLTADGSVTAPEASLVWTVTKNDDGTVKLTDANGVTVAPKGGNNNGIIAADYNWMLTFADGTATFAGTGDDTVTLASNVGSGHQFRAYKNTTAAGYPHQFTMYKLEEAAPAPVEPTPNVVTPDLQKIIDNPGTGTTDDWDDKVLVQNTKCKEAAMQAELIREVPDGKLSTVTLSLYYNASFMIGYPEGKATVLTSTDGTTYTEVGQFYLTPANLGTLDQDPAKMNPGANVTTVMSFAETEATHVKVVLNYGSNAKILGEAPAGNKIFWEFGCVSQFDVSNEKTFVQPETVIVDGKLNEVTWANTDMVVLNGWIGKETADKLLPTGGKAVIYGVRADAENVYIALKAAREWTDIPADLPLTTSTEVDAAVTKGSRIRLWVGGENNAVAGFFDIVRQNGQVKTFFKKVATDKITVAISGDTVEIKLPKTGDVTIGDVAKLNVNYSDNCFGTNGDQYNQLHSSSDPGNAWKESTNYPAYTLADIALAKAVSKDMIISDLGLKYVAQELDHVVALMATTEDTTVGALNAKTSGKANDLNWYYILIFGKDDGKVISTHCELSRNALEDGSKPGIKTDVPVPANSYVLAIRAKEGVWEPDEAAIKSIKVGDVVTLNGVTKTFEEIAALTANEPAGGATFTVAESTEPDPVPPIEQDPDAIVKLDGVLTDEEWKDADTVSSGLWQKTGDTDPQPAINTQYSVRADDKYVYVALKADKPWEYEKPYAAPDYQTHATNFRIWFVGDKNYDAPIQYFDVYNENGTLKYYLAKEETDKIVAAADTKADTIAVEFRFEKATVNADKALKMMITYSSPYVTDGEKKGYNAFHITKADKLDGTWWNDSHLYTEHNLVEDEPAPVDPLPEGAIVISHAGYAHGDATAAIIMAGDGMTVAELTARGVKEKNLEYWTVLVVDENNTVTAVYPAAGGSNKLNVVCPTGGYLLAAWQSEATQASLDALNMVKYGDVITLYNVDLAAVRELSGNVALENAGFTYVTPEPDPNDKSLTVRISGVNNYTWGERNGMIVTEVGQNAVTTAGKYGCQYWRAIKVDNVDGKLTVTSIQENGIVKTDVVSEGGFIVYVFSGDADYNNALAVNVGDVVTASFDWTQKVDSKIPVGALTFTNAEIQQDPDAIVKLDGVLTDEEWKDADTVSSGLWQNSKDTDPQPAIEAQYSVRADDKYVYVALKVNRPWEYKDKTYQTGSTFFRIWFLGDANYAEEGKRQFFDVAYNSKGGFNYYLAKVATDKIVAAADTTAETIAIEFRFEKATVNADKALKMMVTYSSPYVTDGDKVAYNAYHLTKKEAFTSTWSGDASMYTEHKLVEDEPAPEDVNLALGLDGGVKVFHANYTADLTDGIAAEALTFDNNWFDFYHNVDANGNDVEGTNAPKGVGTLVYDLGGNSTVNKVRVHAALCNKWGVTAPESITVYVSADGTNYTQFATKSYKTPEDANNTTTSWEEFVGTSCEARYVKIEVKLSGVHAFLNEVEILGQKGEEPPVDPDAELVGPDNENANFNVTVTAPETYVAGGTVKVTIGIKDVKVPMSLVMFNLCYDKDKVEAIVKNDGETNDAMLAFLTKHPEGWDDSVCALDEETGCYTLAFMNTDCAHEAKDGEIEITVEFRVKEDATGDIKFWVPSATVMGGCGMQAEQVAGNGGIATVTFSEALLGDINLDGLVDEFDYILLKRQVLGVIDLEETDPLSYRACFINGDNEIDEFDYILLKRLVLGVITADQIKNS